MTLAEINKMISNVSEKLVPVTLTSSAHRYEAIIFSSKHPKAGQIMTYDEYTKSMIGKNKELLTKELYNETLEKLKNEDWFSQIQEEKAYEYHRERRSKILFDLLDQIGDEDFVVEISQLSDEELVEAIRRAGERVNELKDKKGSKYSDYAFLDMLQEEFEKVLNK